MPHSPKAPRSGRGPNRLAQSTSPYLRQHADNPVDWYAWGPEAFDRAVREHKPVMLSVGYSACHWCHVMAHESFEDEATARRMNAWFINVKVDREERPDVDGIYQKVVALLGQGGGWPLTVFMTPDQRPFYGGTYFPARPQYGRPSFGQVLEALHDAWQNRPGEIEEQAVQFLQGFSDIAGVADERASTAGDSLVLGSPEQQGEAARRLLDRVDPEWGGLGAAPKFPNAPALELILDRARAERADLVAGDDAQRAASLTFERMWRGGIYDHLRGGFARYSVDREWLVPHFEKMLYDNALLLGVYAQASVIWPDRTELRRVVTETIDYLVEDMRDDSGLFFSATDADSEGVEGKYFCWTPEQVQQVLGDPSLARQFSSIYGVSAAGNFEHGMSILHLREDHDPDALDGELAEARRRLLEHRYTRVAPLRDEKILTAWNALLVSGICHGVTAARAWGDDARASEWAMLAVKTGATLFDAQVDAAGRVFRAVWQGRSHTRGYLADVAALARACLDLNELELDATWLDRAQLLAEQLLGQYAREGGGFFVTASDGERLIERTESQHDSPMPSGVANAVEVLARLDAVGRAPAGARDQLEATLRRFRGVAAEPFAYAGLIRAARWAGRDALQVRVRGDAPDHVAALADVVRKLRPILPVPVGLAFEPDSSLQSGPPTAIVCRGQACSTPIDDPEKLAAMLVDPGF